MPVIRDWRDAEYAARDVLRILGYQDARLTRDGSDGGIDVIADRCIAQVKYEASKTGSPALQRLVGAGARHRERDLLFFSGAGYSAPAISYADSVGMKLFVLRSDGSAVPVNDGARAAAKDLPILNTPSPSHPGTLTAASIEAGPTVTGRRAPRDSGMANVVMFGLPALVAIGGWQSGLNGAFWPNAPWYVVIITAILGWGVTLASTVIALFVGAAMVVPDRGTSSESARHPLDDSR